MKKAAITAREKEKRSRGEEKKGGGEKGAGWAERTHDEEEISHHRAWAWHSKNTLAAAAGAIEEDEEAKMCRGLPRSELPVSVCDVWGGRSSGSPLTLPLSLHGSLHLQPEYYAEWTRCLQPVSPSPSPLLLLTWQRQQLLIIHSSSDVTAPPPLPLLSPHSFPLSVNLFPTQGSQLISSAGFQILVHAVSFFFHPAALNFLVSPAYGSLPFSLLPERTLSPSLC